MRDPIGDTEPSSPGMLFRAGLAVTCVATLIFGLFPAIVTAATSAANALHV
jgi:hypothetical protein